MICCGLRITSLAAPIFPDAPGLRLTDPHNTLTCQITGIHPFAMVDMIQAEAD